MKAIDQLYMAHTEKRALTVERGAPIGRFSANTLGRLNPFSLLNLILTSKAYHDPGKTPERREQHEETARLLEQYRPKALGNTELRLGGPNIIDDILWKKEAPGQPLPWYKQLGGRVLHNPRTGPLGKVLGYPASVLNAMISPLFRASGYSPWTDTAEIYAHDNPITEHELGHAIDFNTFTNPTGKVPGFLGRQAHGTARDLYMGAYMGLPPARLWHEAQANRRSFLALRKALKENPEELRQRMIRRSQVLPAGYGSYVGGAIPTSGMEPLLGMIVGKNLGGGWARQLRDENTPLPTSFMAAPTPKKHKSKQEEPEKEHRKAAESATTRVNSYKGDGQGPNMNARAVMDHGKSETPRPHKTTQGDVSTSVTDRFSKNAVDRVTAPKMEQPVPQPPSQAALQAKKITPSALPIHQEMSGNRMSFSKPYRTGGMVKLF